MKTEEQLATSSRENERHYRHACLKHPVFADNIGAMPEGLAKAMCERRKLSRNSRHGAGVCTPKDVLDSEVLEVIEAVSKRDWTHARYEIRDCIAVLERWDDMIIEAWIGDMEKMGGKK